MSNDTYTSVGRGWKRLPKWARDEIEMLRRHNVDLRKHLNDAHGTRYRGQCWSGFYENDNRPVWTDLKRLRYEGPDGPARAFYVKGEGPTLVVGAAFPFTLEPLSSSEVRIAPLHPADQ